MKKFLTIFAIAAFVISVGTIRHTYACSVLAGYPGTPLQTIAAKDIAFVGTVQTVTQNQESNGELTITFKTDLTYKGTLPSTLSIRTQSSSAACGYDDPAGTFTVGSVWMIYGSGNATQGYTTTAITGNTKYDSVEAAGKALLAAGLTPVTVGTTPLASATLRLGTRGQTVTALQKELVAHGYDISIDGIFGTMTRNAVIRFQSANKLTADGIVGMKTATSLAAK